MSGMLQDLVYAVRLLRRSPWFAAAALTTLALGIGANTAIFSLANSLLFRPLPFRNPDRLAALWKEQTGSGAQLRFSWPELAELREQKALFEGVAGYTYRADFASASGADTDSAEVTPVGVTDGFFEVLGRQPLMGRLFTGEELGPVSAGAAASVPPAILT